MPGRPTARSRAKRSLAGIPAGDRAPSERNAQVDSREAQPPGCDVLSGAPRGVTRAERCIGICAGAPRALHGEGRDADCGSPSGYAEVGINQGSHGALKAMFMTNLKATIVILPAVALAGTGIGVLTPSRWRPTTRSPPEGGESFCRTLRPASHPQSRQKALSQSDNSIA
jgi:hypothetical protein